MLGTYGQDGDMGEGGRSKVRRISSSWAAKPSVSWCRAYCREGDWGVKVWIMTSPERSPRPARPATCVRSWKVRSPCTGIRDVEPQVRVQYAYQRHVGKIQTFGDHLGAQENIYLMGAKLVQNGPDGVFPPGHVRIHARDTRRRESAAQEFLHLLGSVPLEQDVGGPAFRAGTGREGFESAQVAHEAVFRTVVGQGQGAVQARDYVAAVRALDGACESTPVEQQDDLFPPCRDAGQWTS